MPDKRSLQPGRRPVAAFDPADVLGVGAHEVRQLGLGDAEPEADLAEFFGCHISSVFGFIALSLITL